MRGAAPPLPPYAFMAWCSVKAQGQLYLYLYGTVALTSYGDGWAISCPYDAFRGSLTVANRSNR